MWKRIVSSDWPKQLAVAAVYALGYVFFRDISMTHWTPLMGYRLVCLLLLPRRYWMALVVGELGPLIHNSFDCLDRLGPVWAVYNAVPPILLAMPLVLAMRRRLPTAQGRRELNANALLTCALLVSVVWTACFYLSVQLMRLPPNYKLPSASWLIVRYFLGNYLGVLTVTPSGLAIFKAWRDHRNREEAVSGQFMVFSGLGFDSICLLLPTLGLLVWMALIGTPDFRQVVQVAMFLPVIWFARRHGWQGTAIAGAAASVAVILIMPEQYDAGTMQAEAFIAFAMSAMLLLGAHVSAWKEHELQERLQSRTALQLAQQELYRGEQRMHRAAAALEQVGDAMHQSYNQLLDRLRHVVSPGEERFHQRQSQLTRQQIYRLADNLYPRIWEKRGIAAAMREGAIDQALQAVGVEYDCRLIGRDPSQLMPRVQMAAYRLSCEVVAYLFAQDSCNRVALTLRSGEIRGKRWVVLRVKGERSGTQALLRRQEQDLLRSRLGADGLALWSIRDQARLYGGDLHLRVTAEDLRVTLLLQDVMAV